MMPGNSTGSSRSLFLSLITLIILLRIPIASADVRSDKLCKEYAKLHGSIYRDSDLDKVKLSKRLAFEKDLLKRFPNSYYPYGSLGYTYMVLGWNSLIVSKERAANYVISIRMFKKALSMCTCAQDAEFFKEELHYLKNDLANVREKLRKGETW